MPKKILIFLFCFVFLFSFPFSVFAETVVETTVLDLSATDLYNYFLTKPPLMAKNVSLNDDVCYLSSNFGFFFIEERPSESIQILKDDNKKYHITVDGSNVQLYYRDSSDYPRTYNENEIYILGSEFNSFGIRFLGNASISSFRALTVEVVPDPEPQGDYTDFGTFVMPLITSCISDTWNVFTECWWALAFLLIPVVFFIFCYLSNIFNFSFVNIKTRISDNIKNNIHSDYNFKYKYGFWKNKLSKKKKKNDLPMIMIDGQRFIPSSIKKKAFNTPSFKAEKDGVNPFSGKKYSSADIEKEE